MRIEFDPTNPTEAAAVRAMLTAMAPMPEGAIISRTISVNNGPAVTVFPQQHDPEEPADPKLNAELAKEDAEKYAGHETDSTGTPWDERIHSTPATTNKDGTWRAKRGVTAEQIAVVRAERESMSAETKEVVAMGGAADPSAHDAEITAAFEEEVVVPVTAPPAPPAPTGQSEAPLAPSASAESTATEAPSPPAIVTASTSGSATSVSPSSPSFLDVMKAITAAQKDGKIDTTKVKELCAAVGAGESTMGLNGPDNGDKRVAFMALLAEETK